MTAAQPSTPKWIGRRLLLALPLPLSVSPPSTFVLIHLAPGDPIYALAGDGGSPGGPYADMRARYGLDQPLLAQFATYTRLVFSGNLGYSFMFQAPVARVLMDHLPSSLLLGGASLVLAVVLGILSACWRRQRPARGSIA